MHTINRIRAALHEATKRHPIVALLVGEKPRSSRWPAVEHQFLAGHRSCAACGSSEHLQVHHVAPFHLHPERELDPSNLIALCMTKDFECHLAIGHGGNFKAYNPHVRVDAAEAMSGPSHRDAVIAAAKRGRLFE